MFVVTVKFPKNPEHDPHNKKTGPCPASGKPCDDVTGEHHSFIVHELDDSLATLENIRSMFEPTIHVTRVEQL